MADERQSELFADEKEIMVLQCNQVPNGELNLTSPQSIEDINNIVSLSIASALSIRIRFFPYYKH